MPLSFGVGKSQALQNLLRKLGYGMPFFDRDRDLPATDMIYVNRGSGSTCYIANDYAGHPFVVDAHLNIATIMFQFELAIRRCV
ncbi:hypothetical protein Y032_0088g2139 [Ancylostoma ceylanicum]|uniref:Uncharacterized protein n=1 Tax=Ancylostoma ceylanicum TaxID=53326 RepID=A0A016TMU2_9BILA|nr:hypothetical protein Y032_0088g2139 [Ancylostoma ceylanicum]